MTLSTLRNALLYNPGSVFSNVGALLLWEKGVQQRYALTAIDMKQGQNITPEYIRINPAGKVPVLIHDGRSIPDSLAIAQFLDTHYHHNNDLESMDDKVIATVEQWRRVRVLALWMGKKHPDQDTTALTAQLDQSRQRILDYQQQQQQQQQQEGGNIVEKAYTTRLGMHDDRARVLLDHPTYVHHEQQWRQLLDTTNASLAHQAYVMGNRFTLADIYATSFLFWSIQKVAPPSTVFAHRQWLEQYYYRQLDRNSVKNAFCLSC
ncbi:hypothetical protein BCR42DRAFT_418863 [Absidia repens]|uniref:GST N-terminal domain-containing protein n=1 Tax=Absidia repens TaxID=90262 RepID=A0A1X2IC56_9FUNG|nr:hypothetical protein BCR42DRAFT_418863 [Absidia repens]